LTHFDREVICQRFEIPLISFGVFWLSLLPVAPLGWPFAKLNNGIVYGDGVQSSLAMGVMTSRGRTLAATLAGVLVTVISDRRSELWALIVAVLYGVDAPLRRQWFQRPTSSDRLWQCIDLVFPAVACIAGVITARLRRKRAIQGALHSLYVVTCDAGSVTRTISTRPSGTEGSNYTVR
jgi:hypothetical protein